MRKFPEPETVSARWGGGYGNLYNYVNGQVEFGTDPSGLCLWQKNVSCLDLAQDVSNDTHDAEVGVGAGLGQFFYSTAMTVRHPSRVSTAWNSAYADGGVSLAVNQFNPVYSLLNNGTNFWEAAQAGCVTQAAMSGTSATIDVAAVIGIAVPAGKTLAPFVKTAPVETAGAVTDAVISGVTEEWVSAVGTAGLDSEAAAAAFGYSMAAGVSYMARAADAGTAYLTKNQRLLDSTDVARGTIHNRLKGHTR